MLKKYLFYHRLSALSFSGDFALDHPFYQPGIKVSLFKEKAYQVTKRAMDLVISVTMLPVIVPILLLCVVAIKLDSPGPAFFLQTRTGRGGRPFKIIKLRTMVKNAAELRDQYLHLNELTLPDFKITNDPRVTRVGRILRKLSLDEMPQIFNVLRGEMTLVGPRPSSYDATTYRLWHTVRFELKPGITGLAQICGRSELHLDEKLRYDIAYLRKQSLGLDIRILLRTMITAFNGHGAK
ncbi:MAG: sugar transferase [candidate division KSB1 bacterium]|nr:sugar transferase [candidate division KSB1 bacterium]